LRRPITFLLCLFLVASISIQSGSAELEVNVSRSITPVHAYKVALDAATLWGNGNNTHSEMLDWASKYGFDAVFFTDDHYLLDNVGIEDPGFENVTGSGSLEYWSNATFGSPMPIGLTRVNRTLTRTGSSSLEFVLESSKYAGEFAVPTWGAQGHRLHLFGNVQLKASVYVAKVALGRVAVNRTICTPLAGYATCPIVPVTVNIDSSEAWVYSEITLRLSPHSNSTARIVFIYDYRYPVEAEFRRGENSTSTYYFYLTPPREGWNDFSVNLTHLVKELWNQTVIDYGWVESVAVGVMSWQSAYVDVLFDDVSITPVNDFTLMMQYLRNSMVPSVSTDTVRAYSGYSLRQRSPTFSILGGNAYAEDLEGMTNWDPFSLEVRDAGSLLLLDSPIPTGWDYVLNSSQGVKNLSVADLTTDQQLWDDLLSKGRTVMIAASDVSNAQAVFARQEDFANESIWVNRVCAAANSEQSLLEAIYLGHSYVARNNFSGEFEFDSLGFESGRLPLYVADDGEAILHVKISGVEGGTVHLISKDKEIATEQLPMRGQFEETLRFSFGGDAAYFRAVVTNSTGWPVVVSNPIFYVRKPMVLGSYVYISDPVASIQSWKITEVFTHREVSIRLAAGEPMFLVSRNGSAVYIRLPTRESRYQIRIANATRPADDFYSNELGDYVIPLSVKLPIAITLLLNKSVPEALTETGYEVALLLAFVMVPFVIASAYLALRTFVRRRRDRARKSYD